MTPHMEELETFLAEKRDVREYRRALAVKMALKGYAYDAICDILSVTPVLSVNQRNHMRSMA